MKKILFLCIICILMFGASVMADEVAIVVSNVSEDVITISGEAPPDELITIFILNPGKKIDDINLNSDIENTGEIQAIKTCLSKGGKFSADIKMNTADGGFFTALIQIGDKQINKSFNFYSYDKKADYVDDIKGENTEALSEILPEILVRFDLDSHKLYTSSTDEKLSKTITQFSKDYQINSPEDVMVFLNEMLILNAFNDDNQYLFENSLLGYADVLKIADSLWYEDYKVSILSEDGKTALKEKMFAKKYKSIDEIRNYYFELMGYLAIKNNALSGSGHIEELFEKYADDYKKAGFKLSLLENKTGKNTLLTKFLNSSAKDLFELAENFNDIFSSKSPTKPTTGGGSTSGGSFGGGSSSGGGVKSESVKAGFVEEEISASEKEHKFEDIEGAKWAENAITFLYKKGIISGRKETEFAPNDYVTRAEFIKIIVEALGIEEKDDKISFSDVSDENWFAVYVKKAASSGLIKGSDGMFKPDDKIKREDAAVILHRALTIEGGDNITFIDADAISSYAKDAVSAMQKSGLISGFEDGSFAPKANITRAQAAQLIYNVMTKGGEN